MNKLYLLPLLLFPLLSAAQNPEPQDTVKIIEQPNNLIISRTGDTTLIEVETTTYYGTDRFSYEVTIEPSEDSETMIDFETPFGIGDKKEPKSNSGRKKVQTSIFFMGNGYFGQRFNYFDKGNVKNSYEVGFRNVMGIRWSHGKQTPSFSIGLGIGSEFYGAQNGFMYIKEGSRIVLVPVTDDYRVKSTRLSVLKFQVPLMMNIPIGRNVEFMVGAIGCLNTYAIAHTELEIGKSRYKTNYKGLQQRLFTAELTTSLGLWNTIGVYASWSPMTLFQSPYGPQLRSWSIGATINL